MDNNVTMRDLLLHLLFRTIDCNENEFKFWIEVDIVRLTAYSRVIPSLSLIMFVTNYWPIECTLFLVACYDLIVPFEKIEVGSYEL